MHRLIIFCALTALNQQQPLGQSRFSPGELTEAVIGETAGVVRTPSLDITYTDEPTVGVEYRLLVNESGVYHIDLHSYEFDTYLILRDDSGGLIAEDDDSHINASSRLVIELDANREYRVLACALHGMRGAFSLLATAGKPHVVSEIENTRLEIEDARQSLLRLETKFGVDDPGISYNLNFLAGLLESNGDYEEALILYERFLEISETNFGPNHSDTATSLHNLAFLLGSMGEYRRAKPLMERTLRIDEAMLPPGHANLASSLNNLAGVTYALGEYSEAKPLYERAIGICEAQFGKNHPFTSAASSNLAVLLMDMGDYAQAKVLFERSDAVFSTQLGPDSQQAAQSSSLVATALAALGEFESAEELYSRSVAVHEATVGKDHPYTASILFELGKLKRSQGDVDTAISIFERTLAIREARLGSDHPDTSRSMNNLALALNSLGEFERAKPLFERSLTISESQLGGNHPWTTASQSNLARQHLDLHAPAQALTYLRRGQAGLKDHLTRILSARTEAESKLYLSTRLRQFELFLSLPRIHNNPLIESEVASGLLEWKSQVGRYSSSLRRLLLESEQTRSLSNELNQLQQELSRLAYDTKLTRELRVRRIARVRAECDQLELELRRAVSKNERPTFDANALRGTVPDNAALVSFFVHSIYEPAIHEEQRFIEHGKWSAPHLVAWILRPDADAVSVDLGLADELENLTKEFLSSLVNSRGVAVDQPDARNAGNNALRERIWDPLTPYLGEAELVIVSNDQFTATLPLEVLQDEHERYLIEGRSFAYLHDLQALGQFENEREPNFESLLCVGDVDFNNRGNDIAQVAEASVAFRGDSKAPSERWQFWRSLSHASAEVDTIRELHQVFVPDGSRALLSGAAATEERVLTEIPKSSVIHLATHGYFQPEGLPSMWAAAHEETGNQRKANRYQSQTTLLESDLKLTGYLPEVLSGIVLAGANLEREDGKLDGYLTAADVGWLDLSNVELITLSACETGLGRRESGEGMSGFRTTLLRAGARTVVSSLWQVPDDSTAKLMTRFYENLLRNDLGKLAALREAQLWMLTENRRKNNGDGRPRSWGAFVLSGDWR